MKSAIKNFGSDSKHNLSSNIYIKESLPRVSQTVTRILEQKIPVLENEVEIYTTKIANQLFALLLQNKQVLIQEQLTKLNADLTKAFSDVSEDMASQHVKKIVSEVFIDSISTGKKELVEFIIKNFKNYLENKILIHAKQHAKNIEISKIVASSQIIQPTYEEQKNNSKNEKYTKKTCQQFYDYLLKNDLKTIQEKLNISSLTSDYIKMFPEANEETKLQHIRLVIKDVFNDAAGSGKLELINFISKNFIDHLQEEDLWHAIEYANINSHTEVSNYISALKNTSHSLSM